MTKLDLLRWVDRLRQELDITLDDYPMNILDILKRHYPRIRVGYSDWSTKGLHGMAYIAQTAHEKDIILLSEYRTPVEHNFDGAHEHIHTILHRNMPQPSFSCFDHVKPQQDRYVEWQANEGAAEFLVPGKRLMLDVEARQDYLASYPGIITLKYELAEKYGVTDAVINFRLESLKYEITQYLNGIPLEKIEVISQHEQNRRGILVKSINDIENQLMLEDDFGIVI